MLFWLQFIPSPPFRRRMPLLSQAAALLGTNVVMIGIAMTLSIFVQGSVYPVYDHIPGVTLPPFADQQIGAAILWVCGDFWAMPAMVVIVRRMVATEGSMSAAVDKILSRGYPARLGRRGLRPALLGRAKHALCRTGRAAGSAAFLAGRRAVKRARARGAAGSASGAGRVERRGRLGLGPRRHRGLRSGRGPASGALPRPLAVRPGPALRCLGSVGWPAAGVCGAITSVILRSPLKADERATAPRRRSARRCRRPRSRAHPA